MIQEIPVVILCGGKGTRLRKETEYRPKPLVEVGDKPILWHIMKGYTHHGWRRFVLCPPVSVLDLVTRITPMMTSSLEPAVLNVAEGEVHHQYLSSGKAKALLGWRPRYSLEEGLGETIAWYREYFEQGGGLSDGGQE